jgi:peptidoglycan-N-acetylmuramic acid deacetylase
MHNLAKIGVAGLAALALTVPAGATAPRPPLPKRKIESPGKHGLSTKKIEHAYGVPKDGNPHQISMDNQHFFNQHPQYNAVAYDIRTMQPGAEKSLYLTFDCGYENGYTAKILDVLRDKEVPAAFFCTLDHLKTAPDIVNRMIDEGHIVGNHSTTHASFATLSPERMTEEVLIADNYLRETFGYTAPYFRYPCGEYNEQALRTVADLGYASVFWSSSYADWNVNTQRGGAYARDTMLARLHPGAIILLHSVSADNAAAMAEIIDQARAQGYVFRDLDSLPLNFTS